MRWTFLLLLIFLLSCQKVELIDGENPRPIIADPPAGRPEIPRSNPPANEEDDFLPGPEPSTPFKPMPVPVGPAGTDLDVPLNDAVGDHHKIITQKEFKLLKHAPVRVSSNELVGYDEIIRFDFGVNSTGKVIFGQDEEQIGTFLLFEERKPILEYTLQLKRGTFEHYSGREIQVLGHTYVIAEATNKTVSLFGKSVASNLYFENGSELEANSTRQQNTLVKVTPQAVSFVLFAHGRGNKGILLSPNERLGDNINRLSFGTDIMDIRYKGAPQLDAATIELRRDDASYTLQVDTKAGPLTIELATFNNRLVLGDGEDGLRIPPCGYCIMPDDYFIITTPNGITHKLRYTALSVDPNQLIIRDVNNTRHNFDFRGTPGVNASTDIIVGGYRIPVRIGARDNATGRYNLSIETSLRNNEIILKNDAILRIGALNTTVLQLQIVVPAARTTDHREHITNVNITYATILHVTVGNVTFFEDDDENAFGATPYGTFIHLQRDDEDLPSNAGIDATILVPSEPLYGVIMLEG